MGGVAKMSDCECEMVEQGRDIIAATASAPFTAAIKTCDCDCSCDCGCCIEQLYSTIMDDPKRLQELDQIRFVHTPLHEAAESGKTALVAEIMNLMPSFGAKLNPRGLSPLHLAVEKGQTDTAIALAKLNKDLVRVRGKGGLTPLHLAAARRAETYEELRLLAGLLSECPEAMGVFNNRQQSALHVALENRNEKVAELLVNWLIIMAKESVLSIKDANGNTTLHVAARYCHSTNLLMLLSKLVKMNKTNKQHETPLDVAIYYQNNEAVKLLKDAKAMTVTSGEREAATATQRKSSKIVRYLRKQHANNWAETLTRVYYFLTMELTMDMRNTILVVAVLIATATYQGVLQPPGGVYSAEGNPNATKTATTKIAIAHRLARRLGDDSCSNSNMKHPPGQMVMGTTKYSYFLPTNTLAFMSSTLIIIFVLPDRAFIMILQACLIFMCTGYLLALNFISNFNGFSKALDLVCGIILGIAFWLKLAYYFVKAYYDDNEWLLRRLGVIIDNSLRRDISKEDEKDEMSVFRRMRQQYKLISKRVDIENKPQLINK